MPASSRERAEARGRLAETAALWALRFKGYRLLARRFKCKSGEVDLVMRRGAVTAFIEVKARDGVDAGVIAVSTNQQRRIGAAARAWMTRDATARNGTCRFDIVVVSPYLISRHIENAFEGDE